MKHWLWLLCPMWLLGGCVLPEEQAFLEDRVDACGRDFTCAAGQECVEGFCVATELDAKQCEPACAPYEACTARRTCAPRYSDLVVVSPGSGAVVDGDPVEVRAELRVAPGFAPNLPQGLRFTVTRSDGGVATFPPLLLNGEGTYGTRWTPAREGEFLLTVAHPADGGPSRAVRLTVDTTPPTFSMVPRPPDLEVSDGGILYADPVLPRAWRRDQVAIVDVWTNDVDADKNTVTMRVRTDGGMSFPVELALRETGCESHLCGVAQVKLWEPPFDAFRGAMTLELQSRDRVGNLGVTLGSVNVTRWKWRSDLAGATVTAAPAVGNTGVVYVGTTNAGNTDGRLLAIAPNGRLLWDATEGAVVASPTVGKRNPDGTERVYAAHRRGSTNLVGFYAGSNAFASVCNVYISASGLVQSSLALADVTTGDRSFETVYGVYTGRSNGSLFAVRPDADDYVQLRCPITSVVGDVAAPGTMLATGSSVVMASNTGQLKSYALASNGSWNSSPQWDRYLGVLNPTSLAVANGRIFFGSNDGSGSKAGTAPLDGGTEPTTTATNSPAWNTSIGSTTASVGLNNSSLLILDTTGGGIRRLNTPGDILKGAPLWGVGGHVYTSSSTTGVIQARRPLETVAWQLNTESPIEASMNLDCNRQPDGSVNTGVPTGVLYAASQEGKVFALIVDSPGLDPNAPWPRYQHDARNTGNPDTPIARCQ